MIPSLGAHLPIQNVELDIIHKAERYAIIGARFEVYRELGCGFTEPIYQECLEIELGVQGIPVAAEDRTGNSG
jgi:hypothetical protein